MAEKDPGHGDPHLAKHCKRLASVIIPAVSEAAMAKGYAIGVHGSLARDIDLIAVPWTGEAVPPAELAEAVMEAACLANPGGIAFMGPHESNTYFRAGCLGSKAHGRLVWSFHLGAGPYIDLSVFPPRQDPWPTISEITTYHHHAENRVSKPGCHRQPDRSLTPLALEDEEHDNAPD